jgi:hypothetical protein
MAVDYRELLKKYIQHVADCDGVYYLHDADILPGTFTPQELAEIRKVAAEAKPQEPDEQPGD